MEEKEEMVESKARDVEEQEVEEKPILNGPPRLAKIYRLLQDRQISSVKYVDRGAIEIFGMIE